MLGAGADQCKKKAKDKTYLSRLTTFRDDLLVKFERVGVLWAGSKDQRHANGRASTQFSVPAVGRHALDKPGRAKTQNKWNNNGDCKARAQERGFCMVDIDVVPGMQRNRQRIVSQPSRQ